MMTYHYPPEGYAERLADAVLQSGKTITELANEAEISRSGMYGYIYNGNCPNITTFARICKSLNVSADWLLFGKE